MVKENDNTDLFPKKIIFILGYPRSGTTLLNKMLSMHPRIRFINNEFNDLAFFHENRNLYSKGKHSKGKHSKGKHIDYQRMADDLCNHPLLRFPRRQISSSDFNSMCNQFFAHSKVQKNNVVEKKNSGHEDIIGVKIVDYLPENVRMIKETFKESFCIHIIRDPRDVFVSLKKVGFSPRSPFYAGKSWSHGIKHLMSLKDGISRYHELRYEELAKNPEAELKKIARFLDIKFDRCMLSYHMHINENLQHTHYELARKVHDGHVELWRKKLNKSELRLINAGAFMMMKMSGYLDNNSGKYRILFHERLLHYAYDKMHFFIRYIRRTLRYGFQGKLYRNRIVMNNYIRRIIPIVSR